MAKIIDVSVNFRPHTEAGRPPRLGMAVLEWRGNQVMSPQRACWSRQDLVLIRSSVRLETFPNSPPRSADRL